jgi:hypothetical protein
VPRAPRSALGFRVRTGRTIAVLLTGPPDAPHVVWRGTLDFFDPELPETIQPWHAALELPRAEGQAVVRRGLRTTVLLEKEAWERGAEALGQRPDALRRAVGALGKPVGPPWGGHEKLAALAAWVALG